MKSGIMRIFTVIFFFFFLLSFSAWSQALPADNAEVARPAKYLLKAKGPSGEVISTTGRIVKAIALSRPQSLEIAYIYINYIPSVKLNTDISGETTAVISFHAMKLSGDLVYKGYNIENQIFPSLVSFRLVPAGSAIGSVSSKQVLATVKGAKVNSGDCSISVSLHKKVTEIPVIDKLVFYHSDDDYEKADSQMKLIDRYNTAGWIMQRTENLLDAMQYSQLHDPAAFLASNLEVIVLNDWLTRQRFNQYAVFHKNDTLSLDKRLGINRFRKKLIDQDFVKMNVIKNNDLVRAANLFADNLANYFDTNQPDLVRATYLSHMAGSRMSSIGYKEMRDFADCYATVHKNFKVDWRLFVSASTLIRHAMTVQASILAEDEQFPEAMGLLNASVNYDLEKDNDRSDADNLLISKLSQRLYDAYLDIALKTLNVGIYRVTIDYYQKAILLKQTYDGMITTDSRERYVADMICKTLLLSAEKSFKSNDVESALATFEQVVRLADSARLKNAYITAKNRLESISNRPSGYKPWVGDDIAVTVPVPVKETVLPKSRSLTIAEKNKLRVSDSGVSVSAKVKDSGKEIVKSGVDSTVVLKINKQALTKSQIQNRKDSVFLATVIKRLRVNKEKQASKDSMALTIIDKRIRLNKLNKNGKDSTANLEAKKRQFLANMKKQNARDSILLAANIKNFQTIQLKLSVDAKNLVVASQKKHSINDKPGKAKIDSATLAVIGIQTLSFPPRGIPVRNLNTKNDILQANKTRSGDKKRIESVKVSESRQQIIENIKSIHLKIWSGDTISTIILLDKTDSLQQLLSKASDKGYESDLKTLRINYDEMRCEKVKIGYLRQLDQIRNLIKLNDFTSAEMQLQRLNKKTYSSTCTVDKSESVRLLVTLEYPLNYQKRINQLDSITKTQEPAIIIEAYEQTRTYFRVNMLDRWGMQPPDVMAALKSRNETPFLLKAGMQMLNTHRPAFALELLKEICKLEPKPDKTISLQKRLGEMLASGDHAVERNVLDMLNAYNINNKWYNELITAYKKQWKMFSK